MTYYEAIFKRKSVRDFKMERLPEEFFLQLSKYMDTLESLYDDVRCHMDVICALDREASIKGMFRAKAPYYIVWRTEERAEAYENAGYVMEQLVLYLTTKGIGTCYQGSVKVEYDTAHPELSQCIVLAFGMAEGKTTRDSVKVARKSIDKICTLKCDYNIDMIKLVEAARFAPSAFNIQPWRFVIYPNRIHIFGRMDVNNDRSEKMLAVDIGIAQCHMMLAAEELWLDAELKKLEQISEKEVKKHKYFKSLVIAKSMVQ